MPKPLKKQKEIKCLFQKSGYGWSMTVLNGEYKGLMHHVEIEGDFTGNQSEKELGAMIIRTIRDRIDAQKREKENQKVITLKL